MYSTETDNSALESLAEVGVPENYAFDCAYVCQLQYATYAGTTGRIGEECCTFSAQSRLYADELITRCRVRKYDKPEFYDRYL